MKPRVEIMGDGTVRVRTGKVELGQGLHTALAQIVADALAVPLGHVQMLAVDTDSSPDEGVTSGSLSVQDAGAALRRACAEIVKQPSTRHVGQSAPRLGLAQRLAGAPSFVHDLAPAGVCHGRVLHPPHATARLLACDDSAARASAGVLHVQRSGSLLGVVADTPAHADAAFALLACAARWQAVPQPAEEAADLLKLATTVRTVAEHGSAPVPLRTLRARYSKPWIAHASIGPSCALALWADDGRLQVWSHSQSIFNLRRDLALAFCVEPAAVRVVHAEGAGCYGHNGADDVAFDAAWLAQAVPGRTVRVAWSRADELSHAPFGPAMAVTLEAGLDAQGRITHWQHDVWSPGHSRRPGRAATPALLGAWQVEPAHAVPVSVDMPLAVGGGAERNAVPGYHFDALRVRCHSVVTQRRSSALRSLGAFANVFAAESFIDEIAHATGTDALALRLRHLQHDARALAVLHAVAQRAGWNERGQAPDRQDGVGHGLAFARYKGNGAWCAVVAEVHAGAQLQVRRLTIAVDVGLAVNPDGVVQQIEGGAIQATSWVLKEAVKVTEPLAPAGPAHTGWADYPILRFSEVPAVDVLLLPSTEASLGAGEASLGPTAGAIANALFNALGVRVRDLPFTPERIVAAMGA